MQKTFLQIKQDVIRARGGAFAGWPGAYNDKLNEMVHLKSRQELAVYLIDDNANVRLAAKILIGEIV